MGSRGRKYLSAREALQLAFERFGRAGRVLERKEDTIINITNQDGERDRLCIDFNGDVKVAEVDGRTYGLWLGATCDNNRHRLPYSLWFETNKFGEEGMLEVSFKMGLTDRRAHCFAETTNDHLQRQCDKPPAEKETILVRGYPVPHKNQGGDYIDSPIWQRVGVEQDNPYPIEEVPGRFRVRTIPLGKGNKGDDERFGNGGSVVVYKPEVVDHIISEIKSRGK